VYSEPTSAAALKHDGLYSTYRADRSLQSRRLQPVYPFSPAVWYKI